VLEQGYTTGGGNRCFNKQFLQLQENWESIAGNRSAFMEKVSVMGATQVAAGYSGASTDPTNRHFDTDKMGPAKYWPATMACFHPSFWPGTDDNGAMVVMEEFYKVYWRKYLTCQPKNWSAVHDDEEVSCETS